MAASFDFTQEAKGVTTDDFWQMVVRYKAEPFKNQLRPDSVVACFPDGSSVFAHDLSVGCPRVVVRS